MVMRREDIVLGGRAVGVGGLDILGGSWGGKSWDEGLAVESWG